MIKNEIGETFTPTMPQIVTKTDLAGANSTEGYQTTYSSVGHVRERSVEDSAQANNDELLTYHIANMRARREAQRLLDEEEADRLPEPLIKSVNELFDTDSPPERVKGLIPAGATVSLVARAKAGKTTLALNLVKSLLDGTPFLGHFGVAREEGCIAYLNYEMSDSILGSFCQPMGIDDDRLKIVDMRGLTSTMKSKRGRRRLAKRLKGCTSLIVDSFGKAFTGTDQNNNSEVSNWFNELDEFAHEIGVNEIYLIVHAGKNLSRGARGASALEDAPDVILTLSLANPDRPADSRRIIESRGRWQDLSPHYIDMDKQTTILTLGEEKGTGRRAQSPQGNLSQQILTFAAKSPGASTKEIKDAMKVRNETVGRELKKLVDAGELQTQRQGRATLYFLGSRVKEG